MYSRMVQFALLHKTNRCEINKRECGEDEEQKKRKLRSDKKMSEVKFFDLNCKRNCAMFVLMLSAAAAAAANGE